MFPSYTDGKTCAIHVDGEGTQLPLHPGPGWTRFVCISDTHGLLNYHVPSGDVLVHTGDLTQGARSLSELVPTVEWLKSFKHPIKIIVAGNHDLCLDAKLAKATNGVPSLQDVAKMQTYIRSQTKDDLYYLEYESLDVTTTSGRKWKVYGSPASLRYGTPAFQYDPDGKEAKTIYDAIPNDTEILMTHTPIHRHMELWTWHIWVLLANMWGARRSSRLNGLKGCRLHVFGHIHEAAGAYINCIRYSGSTSTFPFVSINAAMTRKREAYVVDLLN